MKLAHSMTVRMIVRLLCMGFGGLGSCMLMAQTVTIGRSALTLPDPSQWSVQNLPDEHVGYVGDKSGNFVMESKRLVFYGNVDKRKAVAVLNVTRGGVGDIRMMWNNACANLRSAQHLYKRDFASGDDVDCLIVVLIGNTREFVDRMVPFKQSLGGQIPEGRSSYYIQFTKSLGSGGIAHSRILLSQDFKGLGGGPVEHSTLIPTPVLVWAEEFSKSNRRAVTSLGGSWAMPRLTFASN